MCGAYGVRRRLARHPLAEPLRFVGLSTRTAARERPLLPLRETHAGAFGPDPPGEASSTAETRRDVRYEPDESPPLLLSLGLGMQYAMIAVPSIVLTPTILIQTAGGGDAYLV